MADVTVTVNKNGPYLVQGEVELRDPSGKAFGLAKKTIALCRCGASANKPFCDGSHGKVGFENEVEARDA